MVLSDVDHIAKHHVLGPRKREHRQILDNSRCSIFCQEAAMGLWLRTRYSTSTIAMERSVHPMNNLVDSSLALHTDTTCHHTTWSPCWAHVFIESNLCARKSLVETMIVSISSLGYVHRWIDLNTVRFTSENRKTVAVDLIWVLRF